MTAEEVARVISTVETDDVAETAEVVEKGIVSASASPMDKGADRHPYKAGRRFSAASITTLQEACKAIKTAMMRLPG